MIEPGIHAMTNDEYHGEPDYLSSSRLKAALPERYKAGGSQDALDFGTFFHSVVLEPDDLGGYVTLDAHAIAGNNPKTGKPYDAPHMTAKFKAKVAELEEEGKVVVTQEDWDRAHFMRDALLSHPQARELMDAPGTVEESAFAVDDDGNRVKARFDKRIPGAIIDLKSTSAKPGEDSLTRTVIDYGYDLSAAHYLAVADLLGLGAEVFAFVFCEKQEPYRVTVADLDDTFLTRGRVLRALAIERLTNPAAPTYEGADAPLTLTAPKWAQMYEEIAL